MAASSGAKSLLDCVEEGFQRKEGCLLPWQNWNNSTGNCKSEESLRRFIDTILNITDDNSKGFYEKTGCVYACHYRVDGLLYLKFVY